MSAAPQPVEKPNLRVVHCPQCEASWQQVEEMDRVIKEQDIDLRKKRREVTHWKRELGKFLKDHPENETVDKLFGYWQAQLGHPRARLDDKRRQLITLALKNYSAQECAAAIKGCAVAGSVNRKTGGLYDEINLIFRDADHIENFIARYVQWYRERHDRPPVIRTLADETARREREVTAQLIQVTNGKERLA